jgi:hypothetical protein
VAFVTAKKPLGRKAAWVDDGGETPPEIKALIERMMLGRGRGGSVTAAPGSRVQASHRSASAARRTGHTARSRPTTRRWSPTSRYGCATASAISPTSLRYIPQKVKALLWGM